MVGEYDSGYENCIDSMVRQMEDMQFRIDNLHRENAKLRELVRDMLYAVHPADREKFLTNVAELGVDDG